MNWIADSVAPFQFRKEILRVYGWSGRSFLGREGSDDFVEARVAAQGVPLGIETELAIRWPDWKFSHDVQLF